MSITVETNGTVANIVLSGEIDYSTQEEFKSANEQVLSTDNITEICVNFEDATFLDSSGFRALLVLNKEADSSGKSLILLNINAHLRETFEIGGFDKVFRFE